MQWKPIESAPVDPFKSILVGFEAPNSRTGAREWVYFVAPANGAATRVGGYALPTHWTDIIPPT